MSSYQYRKSHCGDKTVVRSSYLHNGISYIGKMSSLYWIRALGVMLWLLATYQGIALLWRHNWRVGVSNYQPNDCLFNCLFKAPIKENIKTPRQWPLCREFTVDRWIPRTKGQLREKCFHLMTPSWDATASDLTHHSNENNEKLVERSMWSIYPNPPVLTGGIHPSESQL